MAWGILKGRFTIFFILMALLTPNVFAASGDDIRITSHDNELHDGSGVDHIDQALTTTYASETVYPINNTDITLRFDGNADNDLKDTDDYTLYNAIAIIDQTSGDIQFAYNLSAAEHSTYSNSDGEIDAGEVVTIKGDKYVITSYDLVADEMELGPAFTNTLRPTPIANIEAARASVISGTMKVLYGEDNILYFYDGTSLLDQFNASGRIYPYRAVDDTDITSDEFKAYKIYVLGDPAGGNLRLTMVEESQIVKISNDEEGVMGYSSVKVGDSDWYDGGVGTYFLSDPISLVKDDTVDLPDTYYTLKYTTTKKFDILRKKQDVVVDGTELKTYTSPGKDFLMDNINLTIVTGGINVSWTNGSEVVADGIKLKTATPPGSNFLAGDIWLKILEKPDLTLSSSDISFSGDKREGQTITISAKIRNIEKNTSQTFNVAFYDGDQFTGTLIGTASTTAGATASVQWTALSGTRNITVVADSTNLIEESDETNNVASKSIYITPQLIPGAEIRITLHANELHDGTGVDHIDQALTTTYSSGETVYPINNTHITLRFDGNADNDLKDASDYDLYNAIVIIDQTSGDIQFAYNLSAAEHSTYSNVDGEINAGEVVTIKGDKYVVTDYDLVADEMELGPALTNTLMPVAVENIEVARASVISGTKKVLYGEDNILYFYDGTSLLDAFNASGRIYPYRAVDDTDITSDEFKVYKIYVLDDPANTGGNLRLTMVEESQIVKISNDEEGVMGYSSVKVGDSDWYDGGVGTYFLSDPISLVKDDTVDLPDTYYQLKYTITKKFDILRKMQDVVVDGTELKTYTSPGKDFLMDNINLTIVTGGINVSWTNGSEVVADGIKLKTATPPGSYFLADDIWLEVLLKPDITISSYDISFSDYTPKQGESIQIYAKARNLEKSITNGFTLNFYANGSMIGRVWTYENQRVDVSWTPANGTHEIKVVADENNAIAESNETNNFATKNIYVRLGDISIEFGSNELHDGTGVDHPSAVLTDTYGSESVFPINSTNITLRFDGNADNDLKDASDYDLYNAIVIIDQINGDIQFAYNLSAAEHSTYSDGDGEIDAGEVVTIKGDRYVITSYDLVADEMKLGPALTNTLRPTPNANIEAARASVISGTMKVLYGEDNILYFYDGTSLLDQFNASGRIYPYRAVDDTDITSDEFKVYKIYVLDDPANTGGNLRLAMVEESQIVKISNDEEGVMGYSSVKIGDGGWYDNGAGTYFLSDPITLVKGETIDLPDTYYQLEYTTTKKFDILRKKVSAVASGTKLKTTRDPGKDVLKEGITLSVVGADVSIEFGSNELLDAFTLINDHPDATLTTTYSSGETVYPIGASNLTLRFDGNADNDLKDAGDYDLYNAIVIIDQTAGDIQFAYNLSAAEHSTYSDGDGEIDAGEVVTIKGDRYVITTYDLAADEMELGPALTNTLNATTVNPDNATVISGTKKVLYGDDGVLYFYNASTIVDNVSLSGISSYPYKVTSTDITSSEFTPYNIYVVVNTSTTAKIAMVEESQLVKISNDEEGVMGYSSVKIGDVDWYDGGAGVYFLSDPISPVKGETIDLPDTYYQLEYTTTKKFDILRKKVSTVANGTKLKTDTEPGKDFLAEDIRVYVQVSPPPVSQVVSLPVLIEIYLPAENVTKIELKEDISLDLEIAVKVDITSAEINVTRYNTTAEANISDLNASYGLGQSQRSVEGKYIEIEATSDVRGNLSWAVLKLYYTVDDLDNDGDGDADDSGDLNEDSLKMWWYCPTCPDASKWWALETDADYTDKDGPYVYNASINKTGKYVWANVSHFSVYGVAGEIISAGGGTPSSGGGGGGGAPPAEDKETEGTITTPTEPDVVVQVEATFSSIPKNKTGTISIPYTENMSLTEIAIKVKNKVTNVKVAVKTLISKPAAITQEIADEVVLRYLRIDHENIEDDDIETVTIKFKVEKTQITENNIDTAKVALNRFNDDKWNALTTTKESEDEQYVHYSAESPGLSVFAVSGLIVASTPTEMPVPTETAPTPAPTTPAPTVPSITPAPTPAPSTPLAKIAIAVVLIAVIAAGVYVFVKRRKV